MTIIVLIPALYAAYIAWTQSPHQAFIYVYVPVLLFLPDYYYWKIIGIPDPNFATATILAILPIWFIRGLPGWRFSFTDILIYGYVLAVLYSESLSPAGSAYYQNFVANFTSSVLFPYILAKSLIEPAGLRIEFAKSLVLTLFFVAIAMVWQFITLSPYTLTQSLLGRFFGGQGWSLTGDMRWGLRRVTGPFQHEILAGVVMWTGYRIQRWLEWSQVWPSRLQQFPWLPISLPRLLSIGIFVGAVTSLTRGPMVGAVVAAFIPLLGLTKKRWLIFWIIVTFFFVVGTPILKWFIDYASIDPAYAQDQSQQTVAYRWHLVIDYIDVAMERAVWGWGRFGMPVLGKFQSSIDNHFLLLLLRHGAVATSLFTLLFISMMARLFIRSMFQPLPDLPGSSLGFTLLSVYVLIFVAIATVWLGHQTEPLLFLITGWSEGYLLSDQKYTASARHAISSTPQQQFKFKRIL